MIEFSKPNNPPAFPLHNHGAQTLGLHFTGMTLRDYLAARAMSEVTWKDVDAFAKDCYRLADAMLKARES